MFLGVVHPAAALFEEYLDLDVAAAEHAEYQRQLRQEGIRVVTVRDILLQSPIYELRKLAAKHLIYDASSLPSDEQVRQEVGHEELLRQATPQDLVRIIMLQPTVTLRETPTNTGLAATYSEAPMMNLFFMRDQMITTAKGVVVGRLNSPQRAMENDIENISSRNTSVMDRIIRQFESFYIEKDNDGKIVTNDQITDALSEEVEELRERIQTDIELSQLGLAVGILNHEFNSTVKSIRSSLKDLKAWSDVDVQMENVYKNLKTNFDHLDGYLNLFTPLNRRLNRYKENIPLIEIKTFLIDLFKSRLERHNIQFKHTKGFANSKVFGFRSTFYPVFVNIVDNAIYWLNQSNVDEKIIRLHADDDAIYISNNGIPLAVQDSERIFELGFSRKPNGRGMGLSISKEVLNAENYDISVATPKEGSTITFKIEKSE